MVFILFAFWQIRIRGLWKLPNGRDWLRGKLGFVLMGRAMRSSVPVQFSRSVVSNSLGPHGPQLARPPCPTPTPGVYTNSRPLNWWCHPAISSSVIPFPSWLQSSPASGSFPMSRFLESGGQSTGASASAAVLPMDIQGWFPLGLTGLISLLSRGPSRVFSSTTFWKRQFFGT